MREIEVFLIQGVDVHGDVRPRELHRVTIHAACCAPFDEGAVRTIPRLVLRALEAIVPAFPAQRRVLMRARQGERVHRLTHTRENHLVVLVDLYAVATRDGIQLFLARTTPRGDPAQWRGLGSAGSHSQRHERGDAGLEGVEQEGSAISADASTAGRALDGTRPRGIGTRNEKALSTTPASVVVSQRTALNIATSRSRSHSASSFCRPESASSVRSIT